MPESFLVRVIRAQKAPILGRLATMLTYLLGVEIPRTVSIGKNLYLNHRGVGTVLHQLTVVGDNVTLHHGVTTARADSWLPEGTRAFGAITLGDYSVICPGAVILTREGGLRVGTGTIVGANSVLTRSTGDWEIWAGSPARKVGDRPDRPRNWPGDAR